MLIDFRKDDGGKVIYPEAQIDSFNGKLATVYYDGRAIGSVYLNDFGFWIAETGNGRRYYSNPTPAAYDYFMARNITEREAEWEFISLQMMADFIKSNAPGMVEHRQFA